MSQEIVEFDIVIVGAGPAGLAAAIRLAQLSQHDDPPLQICVLEKAASVGGNILSGAALDPSSLNELIPDWQQKGAPVKTKVTEDAFYLMTKSLAIRLPTPPPMKNKGSFIISLESLCQWLAEQAEQLGVTLFPGFAGTEILYDEAGRVCGVRTGDQGVNRQHEKTERYQPGIDIHAQQTILAEGCRGSLTKELIAKFNLAADASPQTYGIGLKEIWEVSSNHYQEGKVVHTIGWPLDRETYGGSFIYHASNQLVSVGYVIGLDYKNPFLDPFEEFQRFKTHPKIKPLFEGGRRIAYGSRALSEGGWQSLPHLSVPGALIIGDAAGTLNMPKIKGTHTAMKSGMIAAETYYSHKHEAQNSLTVYEKNLRASSVGKELYQARNIRPAFRKGLFTGLLYAAFDTYLLRGKAPWTFLYDRPDHATLRPAKLSKKIIYDKPDNLIRFDKLSSIYLSNLHYTEDQPVHLVLNNPEIAITVNLKEYDAPETRYCPAQVYEIINKDSDPKLQINATNCIHCKTCDIKDPTQNINWVPPQGGDGPNYSGM